MLGHVSRCDLGSRDVSSRDCESSEVASRHIGSLGQLMCPASMFPG